MSNFGWFETEKDVEVKVLLDKKMKAQLPEYKTAEAAGADVRVVYNPDKPDGWIKTNDDLFYVLKPKETKLFDTGIKVEMKPGWEIQMRSRSGMAKNGIFVINSPGTIDSDYRGPVKVLLHNASSEDQYISHGDRAAQLVLKRAPQARFVEVSELTETKRGEGGFGSTGVK